MTKEEIQKLAEKIVLGTATKEEILQYNRICDFAEAQGSEPVQLSAAQLQDLKASMKKALFRQAERGKVRTMWFKWAAAAAVIILVMGGGLWLLLNRTNDKPSIVQHNVPLTDSTRMLVHHEVNTTGKEKRISLPDGSLIVLANKGEVTYRTPFVDRRDIALLGKAFFKVAKDKTKPFTVTSGDISTTALGTEFTVTSFEHTHKVIVRLYEGKVVVKAVDKANEKMRKDVYLYPGQAFIYGTESSARVKAFKVANTGGPEQIMSDEQSSENPLIPQSDEGTWYMFNNQLLAQVLDELSQIFNTRILYDPKDVRNIYFTRKYNRTDSLEDILKEIAIINHLKIAKKDSAFIISK